MTKENTAWIDAKGRLVPDDLISDMDRDVEEVVRSIEGYAVTLMNEIARFRGHSVDDVNLLVELLFDKYDAKRGGEKGNVSFTSYDGKVKVEIRVQNEVHFGTELQVAKALLGEYLEEVSDGVPDVIKALLNHAFKVDEHGRVNREQMYALRRLKIDPPHPKWDKAMEAIADSMRIIGSKEYFQISVADEHGRMRALPINLANAYETEEAG
ncbi:MAG: DUF3164 family protein [Pseudomonadota bacterium]